MRIRRLNALYAVLKIPEIGPGLSQSKTFYHTPEVPKLGMAEAMLAAAQSFAADAS